MTDSKMPDFLTENEDHSITVTLSRSYTIDGVDRTSIVLREPTAGDQKTFLPRANASPSEQAAIEVKMLSSLADGVPPDALDKLALRDYRRLQDAFSFFLD